MLTEMMELDWLDDYDVDACVLAGVPGVIGYEALPMCWPVRFPPAVIW